MSRCHVVTQAYGPEEVRTQALYAAWSALAHAGDLPLAVHVYTDDPAPYAPLAGAIETRRLSPEEIRAWRGPEDFTHRLKAVLIREMTERFPDEKLLYLDADVFFTGPVAAVFDRIAEATSVMHELEYSVATSPSAQMRKFRRHLGRLSFRGGPIDLSRDMWNAGAVGIHPRNFRIVPDWIAFIDALYPRYPRGLVEQYGIGLHLQQVSAVVPCADVVSHYWAQKDEYVAAIRRDLEVLRALPPGEARAYLRDHRIALPAPVHRKHRKTLLERVRRALGLRPS